MKNAKEFHPTMHLKDLLEKEPRVDAIEVVFGTCFLIAAITFLLFVPWFLYKLVIQ